MTPPSESPALDPGQALQGAAQVVASDSVLSAPLGGEVVLLEPEAGVYYSLNEVGARVWEIIQEPVTVDVLCRRIHEEFDVDRDECQRDVRLLLSDLLEHGLAHTRAAST
jgi:hypothetical protein